MSFVTEDEAAFAWCVYCSGLMATTFQVLSVTEVENGEMDVVMDGYCTKHHHLLQRRMRVFPDKVLVRLRTVTPPHPPIMPHFVKE